MLPGLMFPEGFKFGVATAAFQVEGAVKEGGKGPSMWDWTTHQEGAIVDGTNGMLTQIISPLYEAMCFGS